MMINKNYKTMKKIIIIPDVHGRSFWRDLVAQYKNQEEIQIVFLGDYLDPYPFERITPEQSIIEFKDIIEEAKNSNNKLVLTSLISGTPPAFSITLFVLT